MIQIIKYATISADYDKRLLHSWLGAILKYNMVLLKQNIKRNGLINSL